MILTLNFQGHLFNLLYLQEKWSNVHNTGPDVAINFDFGNDLDLS